jgi:hypothetical protein
MGHCGVVIPVDEVWRGIPQAAIERKSRIQVSRIALAEISRSSTFELSSASKGLLLQQFSVFGTTLANQNSSVGGSPDATEGSCDEMDGSCESWSSTSAAPT